MVFRIEQLNKTLLVILILIVASLLRIFPLQSFSAEPSGFSGLFEQKFSYLMEMGHLPPVGRGEVILFITRANAAFFFPNNPLGGQIMPIFISLLFLIVIFLFCNYYRKNRPMSLLSVGVLSAFTLAASPDIIFHWGSNILFALLLCLFVLYFGFIKEFDKRFQLITLIFLILIPLSYFTVAIYMFIFIIIGFIYYLFINKLTISKNHILLFILFIASLFIYLIVSGHFIKYMINVLIFSSSLSLDSRIYNLNNITSSRAESIIKNGSAIMLSCMPLLMFFIFGYKNAEKKQKLILGSLLLGLIPISCMLYLWMGKTAIIQRVPELLIIISMISLAFLYGSDDVLLDSKRKSTFLTLMVIFGIILSNYAYVTSDYLNQRISIQESIGSTWLREHMALDNVTFTDFRLSAPFTSRGFKVISINDVSLDPESFNYLMGAIYYGKNDSFAALSILGTNYGKATIDNLFFSNRFSQRFPGIMGYDYVYLPAPLNFVELYYNNINYQLIYRNGEVSILPLAISPESRAIHYAL